MIKIKSFSVGTGDMFYITHGSDNFTSIDCNIDDSNKKRIMDEICSEASGKGITRFISTHPDEDHIMGLKYYNSRREIVNFYCVGNDANKNDESEDFKFYKSLRDGNKAYHIYKGCKRKWMNEDGDERGSSGINILWPNREKAEFVTALEVARNCGSPNNISPIIKYSLNNGIVALWFGDLETSFMESITNYVDLPKVDVIFAPHHGRDSGTIPKDWLEIIDPQVIIIGEAASSDLNYYPGYNTIPQNSAKDITMLCETEKVHFYSSNSAYSYAYNNLSNEYKNNINGHGQTHYYIGTLKTR